MKTELIAGDTLDFETAVTEYPATAGWTLTYRLVPRASAGAVISFVANATPVLAANYRAQVGPSTTAAWAAGDYSWAAYISKSGIRYTVDSGQLKILPDPGVAAAGTDTRSHARKVLDAIEAVLEKRATQPQEEIVIDGQQLRRTPFEDLVRLHSRYISMVAAEDAGERLSKGLGGARKVFVRL
jgi:hypothetical protein